MCRKIEVLLILIFLTTTCLSQVNDSQQRIWINLGLGGYSTTESKSGVTFQAALNFVYPKYGYKVRLLLNEEFLLFGPEPTEQYVAIGGLYSKGFSNNYFHAYYAGGLSFFTGTKRGKVVGEKSYSGDNGFHFGDNRIYENITVFTLSIPLDVEIIFKPTRSLGFGVTLFSEINIQQPIFGATVSLAIGKLR